MPLKKSSAQWLPFCSGFIVFNIYNKQRVLMHGHQGWNVRHGLCHIYMIYVYIWVVYSFCLFCCLFIIVTTQFVALYKPCKPKPKPSTYDPTPRDMMTSSNGKFSALLAFCAGNSPVTGEYPAQRAVTRNFYVFFDLHLNKRLRKQSSRQW